VHDNRRPLFRKGLPSVMVYHSKGIQTKLLMSLARVVSLQLTCRLFLLDSLFSLNPKHVADPVLYCASTQVLQHSIINPQPLGSSFRIPETIIISNVQKFRYAIEEVPGAMLMRFLVA
jgi:hypothetical protein